MIVNLIKVFAWVLPALTILFVIIAAFTGQITGVRLTCDNIPQCINPLYNVTNCFVENKSICQEPFLEYGYYYEEKPGLYYDIAQHLAVITTIFLIGGIIYVRRNKAVNKSG